MAFVMNEREDNHVILQEVTDHCPPTAASLLAQPDQELMDAVQDNDGQRLRDIFATRGNVDPNLINAFGETPLQIAVSNKSIEIIQLLLQNGADIHKALMQAVSEDSLEFVKMLLDFEEQRPSSGSRNPSDSSNRLEALILAARNQSYDIVKFFLGKGYVIDDTDLHARACECDQCTNLGQVGCSLKRLHVDQALASPVYMALSFLHTSHLYPNQDPIVRAFVLKKRLLSLADIEYELRNEYLEMAEQCEDFAVSLLGMCKNMSEVEQLMDIPISDDMMDIKLKCREEISRKLSVLNFAITYDNTKFVAHSFSQMMLNSVLYKGFRQWENYGVCRKVMFGAFYTLFLPLWSLMFIFCPRHQWSKRLHIPILKFLAHTGTFCVFLLLLFLSAIQDTFVKDPLALSVLDVLLIIWILGLAVEEIKEMIRQGRTRYFSQSWNIVTLLMLSCFFTSAVLWLIGTIMKDIYDVKRIIKAWSSQEDSVVAYKLLISSNSFFAIAVLLAFLHIANHFRVNSVMGPLVLSLVKMMKDILKFLCLFLLIYVAFTIALRKVYLQYFSVVKAYYADQTFQENEFASIFGSMRLTFWAIFDKVELSELHTKRFNDSNITQNTGELLFAFFNIAIILVAINMLIAMMTNTFQSIANNSDVQWKFTRTHMWMQFIDRGSVLPPPLNVIPTVTDILVACRYVLNKWCNWQCPNCDEQPAMDIFETPVEDAKQRERLIRHLIQRHFYHIEKDRYSRKPEASCNEKKADSQKIILGRLETFMTRLEDSTRDERLNSEQTAEAKDLINHWRNEIKI